MLLVGFLLLCLFTVNALGHTHWISRYYALDSGQNCCGEHECTVTPVQHVTLPTEGFRLPSGEFVPRRLVQPSEDEHAWVCRRHDPLRSIRCLFVPSGGET